MAARNTSRTASTTTPKRTTRNNVKTEDSPSSKIKQEKTSPMKSKANTSAKRTVSAGRGKRAKLTKDESGDENKENESESDLSSLAASDEEFSDEASDTVSEDYVEEAYEEKAGISKKRKAPSTKTTPNKLSKPKTGAEPAKVLSPEDAAKKAAGLQAKKIKAYTQFAKKSPFPDFLHPTAEEAKLAHKILKSLHGERKRPEKVVARQDRAGCGDSPSVLDALVRTILSQNTSDSNSTRAKLNMDKVYGGSDNWEKIIEGGQPKLQDSIKSAGLSVTKSKAIFSILEQAKEKYGKYSLDHLFNKSDEEAMVEMISFQGVGPKTASCVLLFCLQRESFAVDTHVYRIAGMLGWRPASASRDETHAHLEVRIPDEDKYGLHILMVSHGKKCDECKAGGKNLGKCELRKAFRKGKLEGKAGEEVKEEEEEMVKKEESGDENAVKKVKKEEEEDGLESGQDAYVHGMESKSGGKATTKGKAKKAKKSGK